ncbi:Heat shock 70 kDa protein 12B [Homo sapiens] [Rhizoctonia solani]|uniref:Heat shock 70 kDa protein 12B [Homo sapiens] n=1 Tax=Rhizoctonia solani TaxID=456999 RepID=A0A0K6GFK5_9AGAM|nr:Heat shock 70 kDa protein 12B [Homo sapiens] [Rhizoctonia solani]
MSNPRATTDTVPRLFQGTWEGENKVVVGIDIGTTQSGVAFAFLEKGQEQQIQRVTDWPGQEAQNLAGKVPTLVWYDTEKEAVSFGAEALSPKAEEDAEDNGWQLAKHFKLHLHPGSMRNQHGLNIDPLPNGISLLRVYSDFLGYLIRHTQSFFEDRMVDGRLLWQRYRPKMEFCIAHPNGWGIREQAFLRTAATNAGLVTNATAASCIRFVTEAEASVHFCIYHTNLGSRLRPGMNFAVCDAGGSTVDTTTYRQVNSTRSPLELEEARASACVQAGAIFVNAAAEQFVKRTLSEAGLHQEDVEDYTKRGIQDFEKSLKRQFSGGTETKTIEVGMSRLNLPRIGIRRGHMGLEGAKVRQFFDICVNEITASVDQQLEGLDVSHILLVGGFGESPYLRSVFKDRYERRGCQITITNDSSSKAVADGAIIWSTASNVSGRAPRCSFGIETSVRFNSVNADHQGREIITCPSGNEKVSGIWSQIAAKGVVIDARAVARESFSQAFNTPNPELSNFQISLISYSNNGEPMWARDRRGLLANGFQNCCTISADLTNLSGALEPRIGINGNKYWRLYFEVCIRFGGTELEAYLEWEERGTTQTGTVTIVPDDPVEE